MIRVRWQRQPLCRRLELQGHAAAAPKGQDLVCAAVSALVCALGDYVRQLEKEGALASAPEVALAAGKARICAEAKASAAAQLEGAFETVLGGLALIARSYPRNLRLEGGEEGGGNRPAGCDP